MLQADSAAHVAGNAFLKLCRLDVAQETEKWARTAPKFAADGRVAVVTVDSGFQSELCLEGSVIGLICSPSSDCHALGR
jgi:hypothetical protein